MSNRETKWTAYKIIVNLVLFSVAMILSFVFISLLSTALASGWAYLISIPASVLIHIGAMEVETYFCKP